MKSNSKKYDSTVSFQCKKLAQIEFAAGIIFPDSLLWIKVDRHNQNFIIYLDSKAEADKIQKFSADFKMCKIKIFKEISLADLRNPSGILAPR